MNLRAQYRRFVHGMSRSHVMLAVAGILAMVGCDRSPVRQPMSPDFVSSPPPPDDVAPSGPVSLSIEGYGLLYPPSICQYYQPLLKDADRIVVIDPSLSIVWTISDTRVINFGPNSGATVTASSTISILICGTVKANGVPGYGYATLTAQWNSPGKQLTASIPVDFGPTAAGVVPVNVIITGGTRLLAPGGTTQLTAQTYDQFAHAKNRWATWTSDAPSVATVNSCQCASNGTVTAGAANGTAHITATVNGITSAPVTITVETPLQVAISGLRAPATSGTFTWTANASGGTGVYTYQWKWRFVTSKPGWAPLGTARTQSLDVDVTQPGFVLQVTVTSGARTAIAEMEVYPVPPPPSPCGHWTQLPVYDGAGEPTSTYVNVWVPEECPPAPCTSGHWESQPVLDGNGEETGSYQMVWVPDPGCT